MFKGVNIANNSYVDDTATMDEETDGVKFSCKIIEILQRLRRTSKRLGNYLVLLNRERMKNFDQPLIWCEGWSFEQ